MITFMKPLAAGAAFRILVQMPVGATRYRLLRRTDPNFAGADDPAAFPVFEGTAYAVIDSEGIVDGSDYYYLDYHLIDGVWMSGPRILGGRAVASYLDTSVDVVEVLRRRLEAGLIEELKRKTLKHQASKIPVLIASPPFDETRWPLVTIHVADNSPAERFLGESLSSDTYNEVQDVWEDAEGWLSRWQLAVIGWSKSPDDRKALRDAIRRLVVANLPVFEAEGMSTVSFTQQDVDDFESYGAPVYETVGTFSCIARTSVNTTENPIREVEVTLNAIPSSPFSFS